MLYNLMAIADKTREISIAESALYALLGFAIVFLGISFLILVVWLVGKVMTKSVKAPKQEKKVEAPKTAPVPVVLQSAEEEIPEEVVAVITAALMAYYQTNNPKCEFTVKRIKRI